MILKQLEKHYNPDLQVGVKQTPENSWALALMYLGLKFGLVLFIHKLKLVSIHIAYEKPEVIMKKVLELEREIAKDINEIEKLV